MELVVSIQSRESLAAALDKGAGGVAAPLPRNPDSAVFAELEQAAQIMGRYRGQGAGDEE